jgi:hypothetical protein
MLTVDVPPIPLGVSDLSSAFDKVFDEGTLRAVHGKDLISVSPWVARETHAGGEKRRIVLHLPMHDVSEEAKGIASHVLGKKVSSIKMTTKQTVNRSNLRASSWEIHNRVSIASLGSEIVHIIPTFYLERRSDDQVYLYGRVEHKVFLPPPFKRTAEEAMASETRLNMAKYIAILSSGGCADDCKK